MRSRKSRFALAFLIVLGLAATSVAVAATRGDGHHNGRNGAQQFTAHLTGYNETNPASLNSPAHGDLTLTIGSNSLTWSLTYSGFVNQPFVAHVHVGQPGTSGGVAFFFCGGPKPACPSSASGPVTITGTTVAADIMGPTPQGFAVGDLGSIVKAIQAGATYANMHTNVYPLGEIRGQLVAGGHDEDQDEDD
jgi:hypothetical protein